MINLHSNLPPVNIFYKAPEISNSDFLQGQVLSVLQKQVLTTYLTEISNELINLACIPENSLHHAELIGQLNILKMLLDNSDVAEKDLHQQALNSRTAQATGQTISSPNQIFTQPLE